MEAPLISASGESKGNMQLPAALFGQEGSLRVLQEVLIGYQRNLRRGTSNTKTRAEVSGGGHKPWRQKGTGNARSGSNRSPLWRKGGIIFGPRPRSYRVDLNEYKRQVAFATALTQKAKGQEIAILENLPEKELKTNAVDKFFTKAAPKGRILVVVDKKNDVFLRAIQNIQRVSIVDTREINSMTLMRAQRVLVTKAALKAMETRFEGLS